MLFRAFFVWLVWVALAAAWSSCDREGRTRAEARTFLALYEATDHRSPLPERERKIAQLEQLTLTEDIVRKARDACVAAHRALVTAERENDLAARDLDKAIAAQPEGGPLAPADTARIRTGIEQAERSLKDARGRFESCEREARNLSLHYAER